MLTIATFQYWDSRILQLRVKCHLFNICITTSQSLQEGQTPIRFWSQLFWEGAATLVHNCCNLCFVKLVKTILDKDEYLSNEIFKVCLRGVRQNQFDSLCNPERGWWVTDQTFANKKKSLQERRIDELIICRAVERVVGGHLEGFDHKTVRNNQFVAFILLVNRFVIAWIIWI